MLFQWKLHMFFWVGHGNLIEKFYMMALPINFLLTSMDTRSYENLSLQEKSMRTKFI